MVNKLRNEAGQTLLIIVLIMVVSLTIGLAVVSRSITNLKTTTEEENSKRAFSAAEAGIERVLKTGIGTTSVSGITGAVSADPNSASIKEVTITQFTGNQILINGGETIQKDDGVDIWLIEHDSENRPLYSSPWTGTNLKFYWGETVCTSSEIAALEIIVISGSVSSPTANRYTLDPCSSRTSSNNFTSPTSGTYSLGGKTFRYMYDSISVTNGFLARVIPLYSAAVIGVEGNVSLPSQGRIIDSIGSSGTSERKITFFQGYTKLPSEFFQYTIFCAKTISDTSSCK